MKIKEVKNHQWFRWKSQWKIWQINIYMCVVCWLKQIRSDFSVNFLYHFKFIIYFCTCTWSQSLDLLLFFVIENNLKYLCKYSIFLFNFAQMALIFYCKLMKYTWKYYLPNQSAVCDAFFWRILIETFINAFDSLRFSFICERCCKISLFIHSLI